MKLKDIAISERPREKLLRHGVTSLSTAELLALLFGRGTKEKDVFELSHFVMKKVPTEQMTKVAFHDLLKIKGLGPAKCSQLISAIEFGKRLSCYREFKQKKISDARDAFLELNEIMPESDQEMFAALFLNSRGEVIAKKVIFIGTIDKQLISPREIAKLALSYSAISVIVAHNHPSGTLAPSECDVSATKRICSALALFDIQLYDHLILSKGKYLSMTDEGMI